MALPKKRTDNISQPTLYHRDSYSWAWRYWRKVAIDKLDLDESAIPEQQLWTFEQVVDEKFEPQRVRNSRK